MFAFLGVVKQFIENILGAFPQSTTALLTLIAAVVTKFGFSVSEAQLNTIWVAALLFFSILTHHEASKIAAKKASK